MIKATEIIDKVLAEERKPRFPLREPRVSSIGYCEKAQVLKALTQKEEDIDIFPWIYYESGYVLQDRVYNRIKKEYPDAIDEINVPTCIENVYCHPDIYIPSLGLCIQVKVRRESSSFGILQKAHKEQCLLEWYFWVTAGYYKDKNKEKIYQDVAKAYEVLYLGRESYGEKKVSIPIKYDRLTAESLANKYVSIQAHIDIGVPPKTPYKTPQTECNGYFGTTNPCIYIKNCFGNQIE